MDYLLPNLAYENWDEPLEFQAVPPICAGVIGLGP